ncbi:MAG: hypothetical protein R3F59_24540 [Myxococcota bacterium]
MRPLLLLVLTGCAPDPCAGVAFEDGTIALSDGHPGWGQDQCFACHVRARLHPGGCLPDGAVDREALAAAAEQPCGDCHGDNGVPGDADTGGTP